MRRPQKTWENLHLSSSSTLYYLSSILFPINSELFVSQLGMEPASVDRGEEEVIVNNIRQYLLLREESDEDRSNETREVHVPYTHYF